MIVLSSGDIENTERKMRMKWFAHNSRMNKARWPSIVHNWKPTGKRPVGRPKQRWMDNIEKDLKRVGFSLYGFTTWRNRVRLEELVGDRKVEGHHCSIHGRTGLQNDYLTWPEFVMWTCIESPKQIVNVNIRSYFYSQCSIASGYL